MIEELTDSGIDELDAKIITVLFRDKVRRRFDHYDIAVTNKEIEFVIEKFHEFWADVGSSPSIEQLKEELANESKHGNVSIIMGACTAETECPRSIKQIAEKTAAANYELANENIVIEDGIRKCKRCNESGKQHLPLNCSCNG